MSSKSSYTEHEKHEIIKTFLKAVDTDPKEGHVRWGNSRGDNNFFLTCAERLKALGVKSVLDIGCGAGSFVVICIKNYFMKAYGVTPMGNFRKSENRPSNTDFFYNGTVETILRNQELLANVKFDCITIHNTLHGKGWEDGELNDLIHFMKKHSKYIVISKPLNNPKVSLSGLREMVAFDSSHGGVHHFLYEVCNPDADVIEKHLKLWGV